MMKTVIQDITIGYSDSGKGIPLVFLHAFPLSRTMWNPQIEALARSYRAITIDLRGHGESDTVLWNCTLDDYAADVIGLLDQLQIARAVFVGLSMGGYIAFSLLRHNPDRVQALVLADTRAQADTKEGKEGRRTMAQVAFKQGASAIADLMIPKLLAEATIRQSPNLTDQVRSMILQATPAGIVVDLMAMAARPDSTDLLGKVTCPTLIIVGENDVATPLSESQYLADRIPGSTFRVIPSAGHLSNFEQPVLFNQILEDFLKKIWSH